VALPFTLKKNLNAKERMMKIQVFHHAKKTKKNPKNLQKKNPLPKRDQKILQDIIIILLLLISSFNKSQKKIIFQKSSHLKKKKTYIYYYLLHLGAYKNPLSYYYYNSI
jgi:hypothetical protein